MSRRLPQKLIDLSRTGTLRPQVIVRIKDIPFLFGSIPIEEFQRFDTGLEFDTGLFFDDLKEADNSKDVIMIRGSTASISAQVNIDKGGQNSIQTFNVKMIDEFEEISQILSNGEYVEELLGQPCEVFVTFQGAAFPEEAFRLIKGIVDSFDTGAGNVLLGIAQSDKYADQTTFNPLTTLVSQNVLEAATFIPVDNPELFFEDQDIVKSFIRINDEIIKIEEITATGFNVIRAREETVAEDIDIDSEVTTLFIIESDPIDLALKLQLSGGKPFLIEADCVFAQLSNVEPAPDAILFPIGDPVIIGAVIGDKIVVEGSEFNDGEYTITNIFATDGGANTVIRTDAVFTPEINTNVCSIVSRYNTLDRFFGAEKSVDDVAVQDYETIRDFFGAGILPMRFFIEDEINVKDFIEKQVFQPLGLYSVVRDGRSSLKFTAPALNNTGTLTLNVDNVTNPERIAPKRSINQYYYNTILYKYGRKATSDKKLVTDIVTNETSSQRFGVGTKQLTIDSEGYPRSNAVRQVIQNQARRFLDRYGFAPRLITGLEVLFEVGFSVEVGDTLIVDGESLRIKDISNPGKLAPLIVYEVINRSYNIFQGKVKVDLLETNFNLDSRYGVFSQSSEIDIANSSGNRLKLIDSFLSEEFQNEYNKFDDFVGSNVRIYRDDYGFDEKNRIVEIDEILEEIVLEDSVVLPASGTLYLELDNYTFANERQKLNYTHLSRSVSGEVTSSTTIELDSVDGLFVGQSIEVFHPDYLGDVIEETTITDITGLVVTISDATSLLAQVVVNALQFVEDENIYRFY